MTNDQVQAAARVLRQWWSFNDRQQHTHSWHDRENFIEKELPKLIAASRAAPADPALDPACPCTREQLEFSIYNLEVSADRMDMSGDDELKPDAWLNRWIAKQVRALASGETK